MSKKTPEACGRRQRAGWIAFAAPVSLMAALFVVSHLRLPVEMPGQSDKVVHALVFGLLAALWVRALGSGPRGLALAFLFSALWGILDEFHQSFVPGRVASAGDAAADAMGAIVVVGLLGVFGTWSARSSSET